MKRLILPFFLLLAGCGTVDKVTYDTSSDRLLTFTTEIDSDFLREQIEVIASDSMMGRDTGMPGQKMAADYLATFYQEIGMSPKGDNGTYFQTYELDRPVPEAVIYQTFEVVDGDTVYTDRLLEYTNTVENVLAYHEGADPELRNEVLVLMAHYDHVGIGQPDNTGDDLYNGADDNGSGTAALMAIAKTLKEAERKGYKPKRSVLFLHVSGEEMGLLGSRFYSDNPVIPIEQTVANFNADMIGRSDPANEEIGDTDYVYLIGGEIISSGLDSLVVAANSRTVNMRLDRRYNDLTDRNQFYRRSDHWNFGRLGVPFVFFFTGVHEDYHRPSDTIDKIQFEKYTRVVQLIYSSSIKVLNWDERPVVDNTEFIDITGLQPRQ